MNVKLISHHLPNRPDWVIINETVPLGTVYEVWGFQSGLLLLDVDSQEAQKIDAYYLKRDGDNHPGFLPCVCFEAITEES